MWLALTAIWFALLWMLPLPNRLDVGRWDDVAVTNFYGVEYGAGTSFRWSRPTAQITIAGVGAGHYDLHLMATSVAPTELTVRVADVSHRILITPGFTQHDVPVTVAFDWRDRVVVDLHVAAPTTVDRRVVGVAIDEMRLVPRGITWPAWFAWALSVVVVALTAFWGRWWVRRPLWRWVGALILVSGIILLRRGDAVQGLWLWMMMSVLGVTVAHQWWHTRHITGWIVLATTLFTGVVLWHIGITVWQPIWQGIVLLSAVWAMRWRRWWWPRVRQYRYVLLTAFFSWFAVQGGVGWVVIGIGAVVTVGAQRWPSLAAIASIGPLIDTWLHGRRTRLSDVPSRRFGLDVLRAFAIGTVVFGHASATLAYYPAEMAWVPQWFAFVGVECFFVLSGWLIGGLIIRALPTWQSADAAQLFLHRRWGRTLPPYWLMLVIVAVAGWSDANWQVLLPYWVFGQNIWQAHPPYFFVAWSLAVEEWFYLLTALGVVVLVRVLRPAHALLSVLLIMSIVPFAIRSWLALSDLPWEAGIRQFVPLRLDAIAIGMLMVWWWQRRGHTVSPVQTGIGVGGAVLSIVIFWQSHATLDTMLWPRLWLIPLTTVSVALMLPRLATWQPVSHTALHRGVQWLAYISYSLYLVHIPWRLTVEGLFGGIGQIWWHDAVITMLYLIGAVWLASQWYRLFEAPLMALRWPDKTATPRRSDEG